MASLCWEARAAAEVVKYFARLPRPSLETVATPAVAAAAASAMVAAAAQMPDASSDLARVAQHTSILVGFCIIKVTNSLPAAGAAAAVPGALRAMIWCCALAPTEHYPVDSLWALRGLAMVRVRGTQRMQCAV